MRCGRDSHWVGDCFAKTHVNGQVIRDAQPGQSQSRGGSSVGGYKRRAAQRSSLQAEIDHASGCCMRCGRDSHWVGDCFAKTHVNGQVIGDAQPGQSQSRESREPREQQQPRWQASGGGYKRRGCAAYGSGQRPRKR
eukprot:3107282-Rhodomonas_salina.1